MTDDKSELLPCPFCGAEAAEAKVKVLTDALAPFAKLGSIILAEAPSEAETIVLFTSVTGEKFSMRLDYFRAARALETNNG